ncbi:MAG: hypothetical protein GWN67_26135 [Phycisphaerae bacterium]|nr:hypothetical protein [Phycisphaerae bacterium]NIU59733.1 hypothetical protein [Phycisphaerae bacterium]NIW96032.1 hypothetical protein [Phycisphaerae bacterium]
MRTPAGKECRFYYEDYRRGNEKQECRLLLNNPRTPDWRPSDCSNCPVPDILLANSSPHLVLEGTIKKGFLGLNRRVEVTAFCSRHLVEVESPKVGCPHCARERPGFDELFGNS